MDPTYESTRLHSLLFDALEECPLFGQADTMLLLHNTQEILHGQSLTSDRRAERVF